MQPPFMVVFYYPRESHLAALFCLLIYKDGGNVGSFSLKLITLKEAGFYSIAGIVGAIVNYMFGGWTPMLEILLIGMIADYFTGLLASLKEGKGLNSEVGFWGLIKKTLMLLSVFIAHKLDLALGVEWCMTGAIYFWIANELVSLAENYGRMGLKMPPVFKNAITVLKNKEGKTTVEVDKKRDDL